MILEKIKITNFKNVDNFDESFSSKINCFTGMNGVGKTNILDAIHYLSFTKSFFNTLDQKNIRHNEQFFAIHGQYYHNKIIDKVSCILKENSKKQFLFNEKPYKKMAEHIGKIPLIMISPYDRDLINLGSDIRRKFIDMIISQFDSQYLYSLISYNKILQQRNNLLKQISSGISKDFSLIELLNEQLLIPGEYINKERKMFFEDYIPVFQNYYNILSSDNEKVNLRYCSQLNYTDFNTLLETSLEKDKIVKYTTTGIHKDDIDFFIEDYSVKNFASQGQQKTYTTALKLAQYDYIKEKSDKKPILLLDDMFDKLDKQRAENIIILVSDHKFGQVFITDTNKDRISLMLESLNLKDKTSIFEIK